jgi:hypothetical protein
MPAHTASRRLVKSVPELWAECSEAASLAKHLGSFGEIRITKLEPETAVAWEGDAVSGAVRLEPSGWGTRVTLTATAETDGRPQVREPPPEPDPMDAEPDPTGAEPDPTGAEPARLRVFARLLSRFLRRPEPPESTPSLREPESEPEPELTAAVPPVPQSEPTVPPGAPISVLDAALDSLGRAHHRPYSRA